MERKKLHGLILKGTEGLIESATDLALSFIFYQTEVLKSPNMNTVLNWATWAAERQLEKINYKTIKRALVQLIDKGLIKKDRNGLEITTDGLGRIKKILPSIGTDNDRKKGEIYLVAYDISETSRSGRLHLRRLLKRIKAKSLQDSLFVVTVDPRSHLEELLGTIPLNGQVLVAKLGSDSILSGKSIADFLTEAYGLTQLNDHYRGFIKKFSHFKNGGLTNMMLDFSFNSIIKDDPNLPVEFLPKDWMGNKAWSLYNRLRIT